MILQNSYQKIWKTALLPCLDFIFLSLGILVVFFVRYRWFDENFLQGRKISTRDYIFFDIGISLVIVTFYALLGLYQINRKRALWQTSIRLFLGIYIVILFLITYFFFSEYNADLLPNGVPISRFIMATVGLFAFASVFLGRVIFALIEELIYALGLGKINVAVVGQKDPKLIKNLQKERYTRLVHTFSNLDEDSLAKLEHMIERNTLAEIYILKYLNQTYLHSLANLCERFKVNLIISPETLVDFYAVKLKPIYFKNKTFLEIQRSNLDGWNVVFKRVFDSVFAICFIAVFWWLYVLIAIMIKLDSKGPIFYSSQRVGPDGKTFLAFKFRRLKQEFCTSEEDSKNLALEAKLIDQKDQRNDGILYKIVDDPRSTKVGRFIEKYSLDELPQFFNVLLGNMSVVGPRPHQPREVAKYRKHHFHVLNIKPGISGYAQINGRSDLDFETEVKLDIFYLENWSFWLDLKIILLTPLTMLFNRHRS